MDQHTMVEQAYKNGYAKGLEAGKPKWIPVTERLPEHHSDVLVLDACGCDVAWLMDDGKWSTTLISDYPVTHWMPLPEPPKEVNNG